MALLPAPEDRRAGAAVLGYGEDGKLTTLRPGTNDMTCLTDNPRAEGISVACYHKELEPFMARGRELTPLMDGGAPGAHIMMSPLRA